MANPYINETIITPPKATVPSLPPTPKNKFFDNRRNMPATKLAAVTKPIDGTISELDMPTKTPQYIAAGNFAK